jgi:hypothetical protein
VQQDVRSEDGVNQMNASITMRQAGQSKKMAETRLLFKELSITILIQFFPFLTHCGPVFFPLYLSQIINSK